MELRGLFIGSDGHLRSGWRFLVFVSLLITFGVAVGAAATIAADLFGLDTSDSGRAFMAVSAGLSLLVTILLSWLCGRYMEGLPFSALGAAFTSGWLRHLMLGIVAGTVTMSLAAAVPMIAGRLSFSLTSLDAGSVVKSLVVSFAIFAIAAAFEEALFRGYILQTFARAGLAWPAIGITSLFFAVVHLNNPGANFISTANTALAGIWFGLAYLKSRDLWFPFGIHVMWNWVQGSIFGIEVSGSAHLAGASILNEIDRGPAWLTGAEYGIEAGLACTAALVVSILVIFYLPVRAQPRDPPLS
jgi:membrane protease YdiL (CAAX protease family)